MELVWDMETSDPDDFLTLLLLLGHPRVDLLGVTVTPGTPDQIGVVRRALEWFDRSIPVGSFNLDHQVRGTGDGRHGRRGACVSRPRAARPGRCRPGGRPVAGADLAGHGDVPGQAPGPAPPQHGHHRRRGPARRRRRHAHARAARRCASEYDVERLAPGSNTFITVGYDRARFLSTLLEH